MSASASTTSTPPAKKHKPAGPLHALSPYITSPQTSPPSTILYHTPHFTAINDAFPKSTLHYLLLPRSQTHTLIHPLTALADPVFFASVSSEAEKLATKCADDLKAMFGEQGGREWRKEVKVGVHAHPSMANLHVHVLSREMGGRGMKRAQHYSKEDIRERGGVGS